MQHAGNRARWSKRGRRRRAAHFSLDTQLYQRNLHVERNLTNVVAVHSFCCCFCSFLFFYLLLLLYRCRVHVVLHWLHSLVVSTPTQTNTHALAPTHTHAHKCIYSTVHSTHTTLCYLHCAHVVVAAAAFTVVVVLVQFPCHCTFVHKLRMRRQRRRRALIKSLLAYNSLTHPHTHTHIHTHTTTSALTLSTVRGID